VCASGLACVAGVCRTPVDGASDATGDGTLMDGADVMDGEPFDGIVEEGGHRDAADGSGDDGGSKDGQTSDGQSSDGALADGADADGPVCMPPFNTAQQCGDCFTQCVAPNDTCKPVDGGFACGPLCVPPLINCGGTCLDPRMDPLNCGSCNHICSTFLCANSMCVNGTNGEVVVIGHDYSTLIPPGGAQQKVLTNSVFIRAASPLRVLAYEGNAAMASVTRVTGILQTFAAQSSHPINITATTMGTDIPAMLDPMTFDVLFVFDPVSAAAGTLGPLGTTWNAKVTAFLAGGGLIVALDGGTNAETPQLITNAGMLSVTAQTTLPSGTRINNTAPGDSVGANVGAFYGVTNNSASFTTEPAAGNVVYVFTNLMTSAPAVIHKSF
jgi:hypothetical protein